MVDFNLSVNAEIARLKKKKRNIESMIQKEVNKLLDSKSVADTNLEGLDLSEALM